MFLSLFWMQFEYKLNIPLLCSMFPRATHETFAEKLYQTFKDHKRFSKPKLAKTDFTVCHYAGDVCSSISSIDKYICQKLINKH